jgi:hypothetical protein
MRKRRKVRRKTTKRRAKAARASTPARKTKTVRLSDRVVAKRLDGAKWERAKKDAIEKMGGVFSARAMQYAVALYKKRGGRYQGAKTGKESLALWTAEKWQTRPGTSKIAKRGKTTARYLPKAAWEALSAEEARATDERKRRSCKGAKGSCYIPNTPSAKSARRAASKKVRARASR